MIPTDHGPLPDQAATANAPTKRRPNKRRSKGDAGPPEVRRDGVQGEGNYKAAREFNAAEHQFVASGRVAAAARAAAPKSAAEQQEMIAAEQAGRRRSKDSSPPPAQDVEGTGRSEPKKGARQ